MIGNITPSISECKRLWFTLCPMCTALSYGVYINKLNRFLEVANDDNEVLNSTSYELQQTQMVVLQSCMALDYLLASQGGTCVIIWQVCCTYISDGFEVQQSGITSIERAVEEWQKEKISSWWDWLASQLPNWRLLQNVFMAVIVIIVVCVLACIMIQFFKCCNTLCWKMKYWDLSKKRHSLKKRGDLINNRE